MPKSFIRSFVDAASTHTSGLAMRESRAIGCAMTIAIFSGLRRARPFGTSSPMIREKYVMRATTIAKATELALRPNSGRGSNIGARYFDKLAPPNAPEKTPTSVMPICTVLRKRSGFSINVRTVRALRLPSFDHCWSRDFFEETMAISAMAKIPFSMRRREITTISIMY